METNTNTSKTFWLFITLVILLIGLFSLYFGNPLYFFKGKNQTPTIASTSNNYQPTLEETKRILEEKSTFVELEIKTSTQASLTDMGRELSFFVVYGSNLESVNKETYSNGSKGWVVVYKISKNISDTHNELRKILFNAPFTLTYGSRGGLASILVGESSKYNIKIDTEYIEENNTKVVVNIQEKK